jgi:hypothetical protein
VSIDDIAAQRYVDAVKDLIEGDPGYTSIKREGEQWREYWCSGTERKS